MFIGYSTRSKVYRVYMPHSRMIEETMHVVFCETNPNDARKGGYIENDDADQFGTRQNSIEMVSMQNQ